MKINKFANTLGVDWTLCGCANELREKMKTHKQPEYFVYREGYVLDKSGKIKEPSIYKFDRCFTKVKGTGHAEFGAKTYDDEYQIFLTRESAIDYANIKQKQFFFEKEQDDYRKIKEELELLQALAVKHNFILIKGQDLKYLVH